MAFKQIWTDEAKDIVIDNWGKRSIKDIRSMVFEYVVDRAKSNGYKQITIPSIPGIIYQAVEAELITQIEAENLKKRNKRKPLSVKTRVRIMVRDGGKCLICDSPNHLEVDHIKPLLLLGTDDDENLQTLCETCHNIKGLTCINARDIRFAYEHQEYKTNIDIYAGYTDIYPSVPPPFNDDDRTRNLLARVTIDTSAAIVYTVEV